MKRSWLLVGLLIPLGLLTPIRGYGDASISINIGGPAVAYHYWYYPEWGVYYDYGAHVYFYQDGPNWVRVRHLPPRFHGPGHHVIVDSERGRPWAHYEDHRAKYPPGHWRDEDRGPGRDHGHGRGHGHDKHHDDDHGHDRHHDDDRP